jgi:8-oxo-dGTP pyrophosphatase MutT (NUDIX family)
MYKVFINKGLISIGDSSVSVTGQDPVFNIYCSDDEPLDVYIQEFLSNEAFKHVHLFSEKPETLVAAFESCFEHVPAAGGLVSDKAGNVLVIFRRGHWDLPKGKIDAGEGTEEAAIREVEEETGIKVSQLQGLLCETRHVYSEGGRRILKHTSWYRMLTTGTKPLSVPQSEEDIEQCVWLELPQAMQRLVESGYSSLSEIVSRLT